MTAWPTQINDNPPLLWISFSHGIEREEHESLRERHSVKRPGNSAEFEYKYTYKYALTWSGKSKAPYEFEDQKLAKYQTCNQ